MFQADHVLSSEKAKRAIPRTSGVAMPIFFRNAHIPEESVFLFRESFFDHHSPPFATPIHTPNCLVGAARRFLLRARNSISAVWPTPRLTLMIFASSKLFN